MKAMVTVADADELRDDKHDESHVASMVRDGWALHSIFQEKKDYTGALQYRMFWTKPDIT